MLPGIIQIASIVASEFLSNVFPVYRMSVAFLYVFHSEYDWMRKISMTAYLLDVHLRRVSRGGGRAGFYRP